MKIKNLNEIEPGLRQRILAQVARDDAAAARARRDRLALPAERIHPEGSEPAAAPALACGAGCREKGGTHGGRRYRVQFILYQCQPCDWVNAAGACKQVEDALVKAGWLPDGDGWRELEGSAKSVKVSHKNEQRVEAVLTRIA